MNPLESVPDSTIWPRMDSAEQDPVCSDFKAPGSRLHRQEEQLALVNEEMIETSRRNETACATLSAQLSYIID